MALKLLLELGQGLCVGRDSAERMEQSILDGIAFDQKVRFRMARYQWSFC